MDIVHLPPRKQNAPSTQKVKIPDWKLTVDVVNGSTNLPSASSLGLQVQFVTDYNVTPGHVARIKPSAGTQVPRGSR
jgi:hypothetical protein